MKLSQLIRIDQRYSALLLLRWLRATNRKCRKLGLRPYCTLQEARETIVESYGWEVQS